MARRSMVDQKGSGTPGFNRKRNALRADRNFPQANNPEEGVVARAIDKKSRKGRIFHRGRNHRIAVEYYLLAVNKKTRGFTPPSSGLRQYEIVAGR